jgi:hypothetical protein
MTGATRLHVEKRRGIARGLSRQCQCCGKVFRPRNAAARFCNGACQRAAHRKAKGAGSQTPATKVARVLHRSKSANVSNALQSQNAKPWVGGLTGWRIEGGSLVFRPMPGTPPFTPSELNALCRSLGRRFRMA